MKVLSKFLSGLGMMLLVHAGFSTIHIKGLDPEVKLPPIDVLIEVCVAFFFAVISSLMQMPELKKIRNAADLDEFATDAAFHPPEFQVVHHRGQSLAKRRRALEEKKKAKK
uniref:Membrane magnesium transporter n=1 Tax=Aureoumbra lagunensis TaxID=44058 RepID=A0A7S3JYD9_9STRA